MLRIVLESISRGSMRNNYTYLLCLLLLLLTHPAQSENRQLLTFNLVHPQSLELVKNNRSPTDLKEWELHSIRYEDSLEKYWVKKQPVINQENVKAAKLYAEPPSSEAWIEKVLKANPGILDIIPNLADQMRRRGELNIIIDLDEEGAEKLEKVTTLHQKERMAVFVNGLLLQAPIIHEPISSGKINIGFWDQQKTQKVFNEIQLLLKNPPSF